MNIEFLALPPAEQKVYIDEAAARSNLSPILIEKDFWVCWLLGVLYNSPLGGSIVFKGGTSLSKVFGVIDRFSEDIDLSLSPQYLQLPEPGASRNQANKWMQQAERECAIAVEQLIYPELESHASSVLGENAHGWLEYLSDPVTRSPILLFHYPSSQPTGFDYLKRSVKIEFGSLTDQQPRGRHPIEPLLGSIIQGALPDWSCDVVALELERTFWEKATILHAEYHRPEGRQTPERFSRHYADMAALAMHPETAKAVADHELRDRVVNWKSRFFGSAWAHYELARPGTFRLVPPEWRQSALRRDYEAMRDMYMTEPTHFAGVLKVLAELEGRINTT